MSGKIMGLYRLEKYILLFPLSNHKFIDCSHRSQDQDPDMGDVITYVCTSIQPTHFQKVISREITHHAAASTSQTFLILISQLHISQFYAASHSAMCIHTTHQLDAAFNLSSQGMTFCPASPLLDFASSTVWPLHSQCLHITSFRYTRWQHSSCTCSSAILITRQALHLIHLRVSVLT